MGNAAHTTAEASRVNHPTTQNALGKVKKLVAIYTVFAVAVLGVAVILSVMGQEVSSFMWGRAGGMFASAVVAYWLTGLAARGSRAAYIRMRIIAVVVPIAVIAIDSIPGALPIWFVVMQIVGAVALIPAAFILNGAGPRAAFRKAH
ncbi:hypothetical protein LX15_004679 [Streptoalloteichus tenebrarius]|uniref:Integral membrane protein n=2 Tax=Streptoalloteichus tenebrarius (strain ATCC 17920 / DSM 40477 / JCM 4838 / CBS 697.72 / NBRC 16177 / NCIMB 11028 / NRRL B-12390 / A12253. 1 / ISP 5477) TaxID=1933 RepID=A0ABT1HZL5_STRSD|nr:hypothetical protein [Streptoalloteichus tenebrarius]MCP2260959.1 hypothetical protein [Streptoalloteichus tenebrarius]BFE98896.1 hypothetical protein GCM10020241_05720 [Streptoalloteichus tenebrarius]